MTWSIAQLLRASFCAKTETIEQHKDEVFEMDVGLTRIRAKYKYISYRIKVPNLRCKLESVSC